MKSQRVKTLHLCDLQMWRNSGKSFEQWQEIILFRVKERFKKPRLYVPEDLLHALEKKGAKRAGWNSLNSDRRFNLNQQREDFLLEIDDLDF